jgi:NAD(P)-dependent dehydrogenase (short-subunit alcohol dehydrogenase family)
MSCLAKKTALVTGASRGIGRATAQALAEEGAQVIVHYGRSAAKADAVVNEIRAAGGRADRVGADLSAPEGAALLASQVREIAGERLDIFVSNAGISKAATTAEHTIADFDGLFATNVRSPFFLVKEALPERAAHGLRCLRSRECPNSRSCQCECQARPVARLHKHQHHRFRAAFPRRMRSPVCHARSCVFG